MIDSNSDNPEASMFWFIIVFQPNLLSRFKVIHKILNEFSSIENELISRQVSSPPLYNNFLIESLKLTLFHPVSFTVLSRTLTHHFIKEYIKEWRSSLLGLWVTFALITIFTSGISFHTADYPLCQFWYWCFWCLCICVGKQ